MDGANTIVSPQVVTVDLFPGAFKHFGHAYLDRMKRGEKAVLVWHHNESLYFSLLVNQLFKQYWSLKKRAIKFQSFKDAASTVLRFSFHALSD